MSKDPGYTSRGEHRASVQSNRADKLEKENKELKAYIIELEDMLGSSERYSSPCAAPQSYCEDCSCGKKEALSGD